MANGITFDTLAYAKTLQEAGFTQAQAEAFAKAQKTALNEMVSSRELATKSDLARLEASLIKWMLGLIIALGAFLSALMLGLSGKLPLG